MLKTTLHVRIYQSGLTVFGKKTLKFCTILGSMWFLATRIIFRVWEGVRFTKLKLSEGKKKAFSNWRSIFRCRCLPDDDKSLKFSGAVRKFVLVVTETSGKHYKLGKIMFT